VKGRAASAFLLAAVLSQPAAACPGTRLPSLIAASSLGKLAAEFDVSEMQSAEGGSWRVFLGTKSGKPVNIVRTDFGETGRLETRMVIASPDAYAVIQTRYRYSSTIGDPDMKTSVSERDEWMFCGGRLQAPKAVPSADLAGFELAAEAARTVFKAAEIGAYVKELKF
jgi:hypothetical protein